MRYRIRSDKQVNQIRGMLFWYSLADELGVPNICQAVREAWEYKYPELDCRGPNRKWGARAKGALPNYDAQKLMTAEFPKLKEILESPLWLSLNQTIDPVFISRCASTIRINGSPLALDPGRVNTTMALVCGAPHWSRLAFLILILRSESPEYDLYRYWVARNFTSYVCLVFAQRPFYLVSEKVFEVIDSLYRAKKFRVDAIDRWPVDWPDLNETVCAVSRAADKLHATGRVNSFEEGLFFLWGDVRGLRGRERLGLFV